MRFNNFISDLFTVSRKADKIRQDEEKRAKSVHFAITACIFALVGIALAIGGAFVIKIANDSALVLFLIIIGVALIFGALVQFACSLVRVIAQLRINKRAASYIALAVLILSVIGAAAGVFLLLG